MPEKLPTLDELNASLPTLDELNATLPTLDELNSGVQGTSQQSQQTQQGWNPLKGGLPPGVTLPEPEVMQQDNTAAQEPFIEDPYSKALEQIKNGTATIPEPTVENKYNVVGSSSQQAPGGVSVPVQDSGVIPTTIPESVALPEYNESGVMVNKAPVIPQINIGATPVQQQQQSSTTSEPPKLATRTQAEIDAEVNAINKQISSLASQIKTSNTLSEDAFGNKKDVSDLDKKVSDLTSQRNLLLKEIGVDAQTSDEMKQTALQMDAEILNKKFGYTDITAEKVAGQTDDEVNALLSNFPDANREQVSDYLRKTKANHPEQWDKIKQQLKDTGNPETQKALYQITQDAIYTDINKIINDAKVLESRGDTDGYNQKIESYNQKFEDYKDVLKYYPVVNEEVIKQAEHEQWVKDNPIKGTITESIAGVYNIIPNTIGSTLRAANGFKEKIQQTTGIGDANRYDETDKVIDDMIGGLTDSKMNQSNLPLFDEKTGAINGLRLIPAVTEGVANMYVLMMGGRFLAPAFADAKGAALVGGVSAATADAIGLTVAGYLTSYGSYYDTANTLRKKDGTPLSDNEKNTFATASAGLTSLLELVNPNFKILPAQSSKIAKTLLEQIEAGVKPTLGKVLNEIAPEITQELMQSVGDKAVAGLANINLGEDVFDSKMSVSEIKETVLITALVTTIAGGIGVGLNKKDRTLTQIKLAHQFTSNPQPIIDAVNAQVSNGVITKKQATDLLDNVQGYANIIASMPKGKTEQEQAAIIPVIEEKKTIEEKKASLEEEKKKLDSAYHQEQNEKIKKEQEKIDALNAQIIAGGDPAYTLDDANKTNEIELSQTITEAPKTEATAVTPNEGDTIELPPQIANGLPQEMIWSNGGWKQKVGNVVSVVGTTKQQQAQDAWSAKNPQPESKPITLFHGSKKDGKSEVAEVSKTFTNVLTIDNTVEGWLQERADGGDKKAQEILDSGNKYMESQPYIQELFGSNDAVQFTNKGKNKKGDFPAEYFDTKEGRFYSTDAKHAKVAYATNDRSAKYKKPKEEVATPLTTEEYNAEKKKLDDEYAAEYDKLPDDVDSSELDAKFDDRYAALEKRKPKEAPKEEVKVDEPIAPEQKIKEVAPPQEGDIVELSGDRTAIFKDGEWVSAKSGVKAGFNTLKEIQEKLSNPPEQKVEAPIPDVKNIKVEDIKVGVTNGTRGWGDKSGEVTTKVNDIRSNYNSEEVTDSHIKGYPLSVNEKTGVNGNRVIDVVFGDKDHVGRNSVEVFTIEIPSDSKITKEDISDIVTTNRKNLSDKNRSQDFTHKKIIDAVKKDISEQSSASKKTAPIPDVPLEGEKKSWGDQAVEAYRKANPGANPEGAKSSGLSGDEKIIRAAANVAQEVWDATKSVAKAVKAFLAHLNEKYPAWYDKRKNTMKDFAVKHFTAIAAKEKDEANTTRGMLEQEKINAAEIEKLKAQHEKQLDRIGTFNTTLRDKMIAKQAKEMEALKKRQPYTQAQLDKAAKFEGAMAALGAEIFGKQEGRKEGVKEEKARQKEFADRIAEIIDDAELNGEITAQQAKVLAKRAANVGTSRIKFDKFVDYAKKVVQRADYANEIVELNQQRRKLKRKDYGNATPEVKAFLKIKPSAIPLDKLDAYKEIIDGLAQARIPNIKKLNALGNEVMDAVLPKSKSSDITSYKEAAAMLKELAEREITTVEEYVAAKEELAELSNKLDTLEISEADSFEFQQLYLETGKSIDEIAGENIVNQADALKESIITDAKDIAGQLDLSGFDKAQREYINKLLAISKDELMGMSVEDVDAYSKVVSGLYDGFINKKFFDLINRVAMDRSKKAIKETIDNIVTLDPKTMLEGRRKAKIINKETNVKKLIDELTTVAKHYWDEVFGTGVDKPVWREVYIPISKQYNHSRAEQGRILADYNKAGKKLSQHQKAMIQIVLNQLDYQNNKISIKGKVYEWKDLPADEKDFYARITNNSKTNFVLKSIENGELKTSKGAYEELIKKYADKDGNLDANLALKELRKDSKFNDVLNAVEKIKAELEPLNKLNTERRGVVYEPREFYHPKIVREFLKGKSNVYSNSPMNGQQTLSNLLGAPNSSNLSVRAGSTHGRTNEAYFVSQSLDYVMAKTVSDVMTDYHMTDVVREKLGALAAIPKNDINSPEARKISLALYKAMEETLAQEFNLGFTSLNNSLGWIDKLTKTTRNTQLAVPTRLLGDFLANIVKEAGSMKLSTKKFIETVVKHKAYENIIEEQFSSLLFKTGKFADEKYEASHSAREELINKIITLADTPIIRWAFRNDFNTRFKKLTGEEFNPDSYVSGEAYKEKHKDAIADAAAWAEAEISQKFNSQSTLDSPSSIRIVPFTKPIARTGQGARLLRNLSSWAANDQDSFLIHAKQLDGSQNGTLNAIRKMASIALSNYVYMYVQMAVGGAIGAAVGAGLDDDDDDTLSVLEKMANGAWENSIGGNYAATGAASMLSLVLGKYGNVFKPIYSLLSGLAVEQTKGTDAEKTVDAVNDVVNKAAFTSQIGKYGSTDRLISSLPVLGNAFVMIKNSAEAASEKLQGTEKTDEESMINTIKMLQMANFYTMHFFPQFVSPIINKAANSTIKEIGKESPSTRKLTLEEETAGMDNKTKKEFIRMRNMEKLLEKAAKNSEPKEPKQP